MLSVVQCYTDGTGFSVLPLLAAQLTTAAFLVLCQVYQGTTATIAWTAEATTQSINLVRSMLSGRKQIVHSWRICTHKTTSQSLCLPVVFGCEFICSVYHQITLSANDCTVFTAKQNSWCVLWCTMPRSGLVHMYVILPHPARAQPCRRHLACELNRQILHHSALAAHCAKQCSSMTNAYVRLLCYCKTCIGCKAYLADVTHRCLTLVCETDALMGSGNLAGAVHSTTGCKSLW